MIGFRDPLGGVEEIRDDTVVRAFSEEGFSDYLSVIRKEWFCSAVSSGRIIDSTVVSQSARKISSPRLRTVTLPQEWTTVQLKLAAENQLSLAESALRFGSITKDSSPYNVVFQGMVPTHVDLGSFESFLDGDIWFGYSSFLRFFLNPLYLASVSSTPVSSLLLAFPNGFAPSDIRGLVSRRRQFTSGMWKFWWPNEVEQWIRRRSASPDSISVASNSSRKSTLPTISIVREQISSLERQLSRMKFREVNGVWDSYSSRGHYSTSKMEDKEAIVQKVLEICKPNSVLDIGANDGRFSELAAKNGARVVALESDVSVAEGLARRLNSGSQFRSTIQVAVGDYIDYQFSGPSLLPPNARFSRGVRLRSDLVLFLAVSHHSIISQGWPPETVAEALSNYGERILVEFPVRPDPMVEHLLSHKKQPQSFVERYSLELFLKVAMKWFLVEETWDDALRPMVLLKSKA